MASVLTLTDKQIAVIHESMPARTKAELQAGPAVAEPGTVSVSYVRGFEIVYFMDVMPDGMVHELEEDDG